ncbi:hypothetical protein [Tepidanaerobacter sp. EBM-38]|jgi:hypothetical protein|nr:hypothetical protein [Tepidanaerobacter sp. EBM-38]
MAKSLQFDKDRENFYKNLFKEKNMNIKNIKDEAEIYAEYIKEFTWVKT